ncbi:DNA alkylation repair protein [Mucilaginibacter ginsenosidivorans]|uniref:DNA alkylation repair protein n=1 Tax=Mucilaginibacter ginsenosidivorans TaxID=398053 RepID=A0A5B8URG4_9SPHI|nr:DNA alkylation repair protein [Mucilaginibacter ginsenosidivorans]QEC61660.1 DNA alkylation repair protein [Mucilaginibacter ginsenosidivorans]
MTVGEIMAELQANGNDGIKKILLKHGVKEPFFGVKVEFLKTIQKRVKHDYQLAKDLFDTGNADAMYLAGLIADDARMTKADLQNWIEKALSNNINEYTVPWVAAEGKHGYELGMEWIDSSIEHIAAAGWATLSNWIALKPDNELDIEELKALLDRVEKTIHTSPNQVRSTMNGFVMAAGIYVLSLTADANQAAKRIGDVMVDKGDTACKVPDAVTYIQKAKDKGNLGKKKKTVKC